MPEQYKYNPLTGQMDLVGKGADYTQVLARLAALEARQLALEDMMLNTPYLNWEYIQTSLEWETFEDVADLNPNS